MKLARRVMELAESATLAVSAKAARMKAEGVDVIGFGYVFSSTVVVILLSGMLTFRLEEPRHRLDEEAQPVDVATPE